MWYTSCMASVQRNKVLITSRDANGDIRTNLVTVVQGGIATVVTATNPDLDVARNNVYSTTALTTINEEIHLSDVSLVGAP